MPIKDIIYLCAIAAVAGVLAWWHHQAVVEGEARITAQDAKARQEQHDADTKTNADTVAQLQQDNVRLKALAAAPAPSVLCVPQVRYVRAGPAPGPAQPAVAPANGASAAGVPAGSGVVDLGEPLRNIEIAAQYAADYRQRLWQWSVRQAHAK
jgi:hypothetical protein